MGTSAAQRHRRIEINLALDRFVQAAADCPAHGRVFLSMDHAQIVADVVMKWQHYARRKVSEDQRRRARKKRALAQL